MVNFAAYLLLADGSESKSWLPAPADGLHALQQASECQTAEISTMNAAANSSQEEAFHQSVITALPVFAPQIDEKKSLLELSCSVCFSPHWSSSYPFLFVTI